MQTLFCKIRGIGYTRLKVQLTYNPSAMREVLNQIFGFRELLEIRRPRATALQQGRGRHAGVTRCGGRGVESGGVLLGIGGREREDGEGPDLFFEVNVNLGTEGTVSISWYLLGATQTVERGRERPDRLRI